MRPLGPTLVELRDLAVTRDDALAVQDLSLTLAEGEILALLGPNGAGKSSLLLALAGLLEPCCGELRFAGRVIAGRALEPYRREATLVFQEPLLLDTTVEANLAQGLRWRGFGKAERDARVRSAAERFGISHLLRRPARELSGGEAQRASLARACALKPRLLLLDEPFAALDPPTREALLHDLRANLEATGCTAVLATHDLMEALCLADTVAVLKEGRLVQHGPGSQVVNHPADAFVANFLGMETILDGEVVASGLGVFTARVEGREVIGAGDLTVGHEVTLGVRPENVTISLHGEADSSARNSFAGRVTRIAARGPFFKVELDCGFFLSAFVSAPSLEQLALRPGREVVASFKATAVHLIRR